MTASTRKLTTELLALIKQPSLIGQFVKLSVKRLQARLQWVRHSNNPQRIVKQGYDRMAGDYGSWTLRHQRPDRDKYTDLLIDQVPAGADLLELGCGPGIPTTQKLSKHFNVTANDISASCLVLAKDHAPNATFIQADMTELQFSTGSFDAVAAFYAFHHIPRQKYAPLLRSISSWLRPGGLFVAALYPYDVDNLVTEDWHGATMYWSSFDKEKTLQLLSDSGLNILSATEESAIEDGKETTFLWVVSAKSDSGSAS